MIGRTNCVVGGGATGLPEFTYTGDYALLDDGGKNWRVKFLTSGTLTFSKSPGLIDVFLVGGGGGTGSNRSGGGGGGYTATHTVALNPSNTYEVVVGAGGTGATDGGSTSAFEFSVDGGTHGTGTGVVPARKGGSGGSGGGGGGSSSTDGGAGGSDGADGTAGGNGSAGTENVEGAAGTGQGTTTREFGETSGDLYAGGGGGGSKNGGEPGGEGGGGTNGSDGTPNTGGGGGGGIGAGGNGGSGIVIIRNHREAAAL